MDSSPIFSKTESLLQWILPHTANFPKHERFRLAKRIEDAAFELHGYLLEALRSPQPRAQLLQADCELAKLRVYLRLSVEYRYTAVNQYEYAAMQVNEVGKLLGAWLKKVAYN